jgi:hypothetical protein
MIQTHQPRVAVDFGIQAPAFPVFGIGNYRLRIGLSLGRRDGALSCHLCQEVKRDHFGPTRVRPEIH